MNTIKIMEDDAELEVKIENEYTRCIKTKMPPWMKKDKKITSAFNKLITDSERHERLFREMEEKLIK